jgi:glycosyltransferase involved in cell wall biosynthesis
MKRRELGSSQWICCQLGAREHYAVPRALYAHGALTKLITEFWFPPGTEFLRILPSSLKQDLRGRYHPDLANADVTSLNRSALTFEIISRIRGQSGWAKIMARNRWFERKAVDWLRRNADTLKAEKLKTKEPRTEKLEGNAEELKSETLKSELTSRNADTLKAETRKTEPIVFAYSYAAREICRFAKQRGWKTVLGQIDPGPVEEKIVAEEAARVPELAGDWQPAPPEYWDSWQEECSLADHIIVNSEWSRAALVKGGVSGEKLSVIPLAYEMPDNSLRPGGAYAPVGEPITRSYPAHFTRDRPLRVLFLGQVNLRKGVARLFDAIRQLKDEPIEFQFVGPMQVAVPEDLKNNPRVHWFGAVTRGKTSDFYRTADVLVFPTLSDGFGLTQLEAQAHDLAVIASRYCGEVVKHDMNGLLLERPTVDAIVEALRFCLADPARLATFSTASRVEDRFSIDALGASLLSLASA